MTTLREAAQMALKVLEYPGPSWPDARGEAAEALRAALAAPPQELELPKVQLWQFLKMIEGKEDFRGIPLMRTEWPTQGEALAQPEQEELGEIVPADEEQLKRIAKLVEQEPPQREWRGLTDEDREEIDKWIEFKEAGGNEPVPAQKLVTYVEAKLREKNSG